MFLLGIKSGELIGFVSKNQLFRYNFSTDTLRTYSLECNYSGISCLAETKYNTFVIFSDECKNFHAIKLELSNGEVFNVVKFAVSPKACTKIIYTDSCLYFSDKFGDIKALKIDLDDLSLDDISKNSNFSHLIGHYSMVLTFEIIEKNYKYLISCDRDEKIRISHVQRPWLIDQFLLNHTSFVCSLVYFERSDNRYYYIVSGGGDNYLVLWEWQAGDFEGLYEGTNEWEEEELKSRARILHIFSFPEVLSLNFDNFSVLKICKLTDYEFCVLIEDCTIILVFEIDKNSICMKKIINLDDQPIDAIFDPKECRILIYTTSGIIQDDKRKVILSFQNPDLPNWRKKFLRKSIYADEFDNEQ